MPEDISSVPETLYGLVRSYSPTGSERPAVEFLVQRMQQLGFTRSFADEAGNAVGCMGEGPRQIILLGHIDTVPGEIPARLEAGCLFGRGSVDAKGPLAAFVDAVAAQGPRAGWQLVVIGAVGEEGDSPGAQFAASRYHPDFAIIGEPSRWDRITLGYKGSAWTRIVVRRSLSHTAGKGESACEAAADIWKGLQQWAVEFSRDRSRAFDRLQLTLRGMESGSDGFEEWAALRVGARLPQDLPPEKWYEQLGNLPGAADVSGVRMEPLGFPIPAFQAEKNTSLVRAFLAGIRAQGGAPGFVLKTGTADLNIVAPAWGCPAAAYGPGDSALDHTPQENLPIEEYLKSVAVLREVLTRLCQMKSVQ